MSLEDFGKQYEIATSLVKQWPLWKQNLLEDSSKPTLTVPREPVDNMRFSEQSSQAPKQND